MSRDNATRFESWNRTGADADTRHFTPQQPSGEDQLNTELENFRNIRLIEDLFANAPEAGRAMTAKPQAEAAAVLRKENERRLAALNQKFAPQQNRKPRQGWDQSAINSQVRSLMNQK